MKKNNNSPQVNLNLNVRGLPQSATLEINERSADLKNQGRKIYKLGLGQSPFPVPKPVVNELKKNAHQKDYLPVKGLPALREAVAGYHSRKHGLSYSADNVLIGPGSKELMFMLQYVYYGDLVIPTPSWVSYAPQAQIIGRNVHWIPTKAENNWRLTAKELKHHCESDPEKPRIVILNYPSNPVGVTYSKEELKQIAKVAREHKIILLSDEIYGEIHHEGRHLSISRFYPEGTILSGGLSKWCGAGGWRLGTFVFPDGLKWLLNGMAVMASETFTATSAPIQFAAVRAFQGGEEIEKYLWRSRWILKKLGNHIQKRLSDEGIFVPEPEGGFYLFPDFSPLKEKLEEKGITGSRKLAEKLLVNTGVAVLPGVVFGRPESELTVRIAYVDFDGTKAIHAGLNIEKEENIDVKFLSTYCSGMLKAVNLICEWVRR